jgi:hypothetical protein
MRGVVTTGGILAVRRFESWARRNTTYFACFAAGVLIAVSFMHIVPKSLAMNTAPAYLCTGYLLMYLINRFLTAYVCDKPETAEYALGLLDGIVYSISFSVSMFTGTVVALGMVLHEFPEGIVTYALLVKSGFTERRSFLLSFWLRGSRLRLGRWYPTHASARSISLCWVPCLLFRLAHGSMWAPHTFSPGRSFSVVALAAGVLVALGIVLSTG